MEFIVTCIKTGVTLYITYVIIYELGQKYIAKIFKAVAIVLFFSIILPGFSKIGQSMSEARQDVQNLTNAIKVVGEARDNTNTFASKFLNSPILNFGAKATLLDKYLEFPLPNIKSPTITQGFNGIDHHGIDIACETGTPIITALDGKISEVSIDSNGIYGNYIIVDHEGGFQTLYAHCSKFNVKKWDHVFSKDIIAFSGNTGKSSGSHLHFEVRFSGKAVDPMKYFKGGK